MSEASPTPPSFSEGLRPKAAKILQPIGRGLIRLGITADGLTFLGFVIAVVVGVLAATGHLVWAGLALILSAPMDALDGTVARLSGVKSKFGAFWDSTVDRYSEASVLLGVMIYGVSLHDNWIMILPFVALWGSLMVSYTRSRAETLAVDCKVGILTRLERVVITVVMLLLNPLWPNWPLLIGLIALAAGSHVTVIQRIIHVRHTMREQGL